MTTYPWDKDVPHFSPDWDEIKSKAEHYKTAYRRSDGRIVELIGVTKFEDGLEQLFRVRDEGETYLMAVDKLCGFCL